MHMLIGGEGEMVSTSKASRRVKILNKMDNHVLNKTKKSVFFTA